jgi:hypothetical protein
MRRHRSGSMTVDPTHLRPNSIRFSGADRIGSVPGNVRTDIDLTRIPEVVPSGLRPTRRKACAGGKQGLGTINALASVHELLRIVGNTYEASHDECGRDLRTNGPSFARNRPQAPFLGDRLHLSRQIPRCSLSQPAKRKTLQIFGLWLGVNTLRHAAWRRRHV